MRKLLKIIGITLLFVAGLIAAGVSYLAMKKPAMRPPSTEIIERTPQRVARGKYLVEHVADCMGCHSDHDFDRFGIPVKAGTRGQGGFTFTKDFGVPGVVAAQNITSDAQTGVGNWTDGEILRAIREGVRRDGTALFPMMPYQKFRKMSDEDARSVVAYLRTLPPVHNQVPTRKLDFPVNLFIKSAPQPLAGPVSAPDPSNHLAYGEYLVTIAGCEECHTPHDDHGQQLAGMAYAGGWEMKGPWGRVVSPNITPDTDTYFGRATKEEFIARVKAFESMSEADAPVAEKGRNTIMPWLGFSGMTESDLGAIYDYMKTVKPIRNKVNPFPDAVPVKSARMPN
ncbi:MAG: cytochrome C [Acidobacteriota bacterium]